MTGEPAPGAAPAPEGAANGPVRTIFFGSGPFALPILDAVATDPRLRVVAVVTAPDRPAGRGGELRRTPVAVRATERGLPLLQPERVRAPEVVAALRELEPELGVLADYGQILSRDLLELSRLGILNVHPSLLPRHRGASPIQATIADGDARAGVSIIEMDEGVDDGPLVAATAWSLTGRERAPDLERQAALTGAELLTRTLGPWLDGSAVIEPQETARASVTHQLRREDGRLDPSRPAEELERRVRAFDPWPGSFADTAVGRVLVHEASVAPSRSDDVPGMFVQQDHRLALATHHGRLVIEVAQREGREAMSGEDFLRGHRRLVGTRLQAVPEGAP